MPEKSISVVSGLILVLLWLRIGQLSTASLFYLDVFWWGGLWCFHWRRQTGRHLNLLSLALLLPGVIMYGGLGLGVSASVLGILQLRSLRDEIALEEHGWERYWF